jgi:hypothetical protein
MVRIQLLSSSPSRANMNQTCNKVVDGDLNTSWQASDEQRFNNSWLAVDFHVRTTFNKVRIIEYGQCTTGYRIEYWNETNWLIAYTGTAISSHGASFGEVTSSHMRIVFQHRHRI